MVVRFDQGDALTADLDEVRSVVARVAHCIDRKQWADLRVLFASEVETDYTFLVRRNSADAIGR
jgi:hypothetical protein